MVAEWVTCACRDTIEAKFTLGVFNVSVAFASRSFDRISALAAKHRFALGLFQARNKLLEDVQALAHLIHADQVTVVDVTVLAHGYVEVQFRVDTIGLCMPNVIRYTTGAQ